MSINGMLCFIYLLKACLSNLADKNSLEEFFEVDKDEKKNIDLGIDYWTNLDDFLVNSQDGTCLVNFHENIKEEDEQNIWKQFSSNIGSDRLLKFIELSDEILKNGDEKQSEKFIKLIGISADQMVSACKVSKGHTIAINKEILTGTGRNLLTLFEKSKNLQNYIQNPVKKFSFLLTFIDFEKITAFTTKNENNYKKYPIESTNHSDISEIERLDGSIPKNSLGGDTLDEKIIDEKLLIDFLEESENTKAQSDRLNLNKNSKDSGKSQAKKSEKTSNSSEMSSSEFISAMKQSIAAIEENIHLNGEVKPEDFATKSNSMNRKASSDDVETTNSAMKCSTKQNMKSNQLKMNRRNHPEAPSWCFLSHNLSKNNGQHSQLPHSIVNNNNNSAVQGLNKNLIQLDSQAQQIKTPTTQILSQTSSPKANFNFQFDKNANGMVQETGASSDSEVIQTENQQKKRVDEYLKDCSLILASDENSKIIHWFDLDKFIPLNRVATDPTIFDSDSLSQKTSQNKVKNKQKTSISADSHKNKQDLFEKNSNESCLSLLIQVDGACDTSDDENIDDIEDEILNDKISAGKRKKMRTKREQVKKHSERIQNLRKQTETGGGSQQNEQSKTQNFGSLLKCLQSLNSNIERQKTIDAARRDPNTTGHFPEAIKMMKNKNSKELMLATVEEAVSKSFNDSTEEESNSRSTSNIDLACKSGNQKSISSRRKIDSETKSAKNSIFLDQKRKTIGSPYDVASKICKIENSKQSKKTANLLNKTRKSGNLTPQIIETMNFEDSSKEQDEQEPITCESSDTEVIQSKKAGTAENSPESPKESIQKKTVGTCNVFSTTEMKKISKRGKKSIGKEPIRVESDASELEKFITNFNRPEITIVRNKGNIKINRNDNNEKQSENFINSNFVKQTNAKKSPRNTKISVFKDQEMRDKFNLPNNTSLFRIIKNGNVSDIKNPHRRNLRRKARINYDESSDNPFQISSNAAEVPVTFSSKKKNKNFESDNSKKHTKTSLESEIYNLDENMIDLDTNMISLDTISKTTEKTSRETTKSNPQLFYTSEPVEKNEMRSEEENLQGTEAILTENDVLDILNNSQPDVKSNLEQIQIELDDNQIFSEIFSDDISIDEFKLETELDLSIHSNEVQPVGIGSNSKEILDKNSVHYGTINTESDRQIYLDEFGSNTSGIASTKPCLHSSDDYAHRNREKVILEDLRLISPLNCGELLDTAKEVAQNEKIVNEKFKIDLNGCLESRPKEATMDTMTEQIAETTEELAEDISINDNQLRKYFFHTLISRESSKDSYQGNDTIYRRIFDCINEISSEYAVKLISDSEDEEKAERGHFFSRIKTEIIDPDSYADENMRPGSAKYLGVDKFLPFKKRRGNFSSPNSSHYEDNKKQNSERDDLLDLAQILHFQVMETDKFEDKHTVENEIERLNGIIEIKSLSTSEFDSLTEESGKNQENTTNDTSEYFETDVFSSQKTEQTQNTTNETFEESSTSQITQNSPGKFPQQPDAQNIQSQEIQSNLNNFIFQVKLHMQDLLDLSKTLFPINDESKNAGTSQNQTEDLKIERINLDNEILEVEEPITINIPKKKSIITKNNIPGLRNKNIKKEKESEESSHSHRILTASTRSLIKNEPIAIKNSSLEIFAVPAPKKIINSTPKSPAISVENNSRTINLKNSIYISTLSLEITPNNSILKSLTFNTPHALKTLVILVNKPICKLPESIFVNEIPFRLVSGQVTPFNQFTQYARVFSLETPQILRFTDASGANNLLDLNVEEVLNNLEFLVYEERNLQQ